MSSPFELLLVEDLMMQKYGFSMTDKGTTAVPSDVGGFYLASDVDARIAAMRKAFETSSTDEENKLRARVVELEEALKQREDQLRAALDQQRSDH